jgi:hypothetical protein
MRSQWTRAWLLGPLAAATIETDSKQFESVVMADDCRLLRKALVWFQAEKTTPNPNILAGTLPRDQRIRIADILSWPSDFQAWRRLIDFLLARKDSIPVALFPDMVSIFEVWQNALAGLKNRVSKAIVQLCADWLRELDGQNAAKTSTNKTRWHSLGGYGDFRQSLIRLILGSAQTLPEFTEEYLKRAIAAERVSDDDVKRIIDFSPILASTHPELLVELTLAHLKQELPDEQIERERQERQWAAEHRKEVLAKPESERTRHDELALSNMFHSIGSGFSHHDWNRLSIDDDFQNFWPPSPLREPFHSLFKQGSEQALRLLNDLTNHAITAWRQLHRLDYQRLTTPIALELQFPWGNQQFWGTAREYLWHRGTWAPKAIASGFMALEEWCLAELGRGRDPDELVRQIVQRNQCVAILGVATMIALHTHRISETVLPLVTSQRTLAADYNRFAHDMTSSSANLIGFTNPNDREHAAAVEAANERPVRKTQLSWLIPLYVFAENVGRRTREAILGFSQCLPYEYEEHRDVPEAQAHLGRQAAEYAELAERKNYTAKPAKEPGLVEIHHVSPTASAPENVAKRERALLSIQEGNLWACASKAFENGKLEDQPYSLSDTTALAKKLDSRTLYRAFGDSDQANMRRGAVAATAAVVLRFRDGPAAGDLAWARKVLKRAIRAPEARDVLWSPMSVVPWHHCIFAARGLGADLRYGTADAQSAIALLSLVAHPLEMVTLAALGETGSLWEQEPRLSWAAVSLALMLCHIEPARPGQRRGPSDPIHPAERVEQLLKQAMEIYQGTGAWPDLPLPPPAWVKVKTSTKRARHPPVVNEDVESFEFAEDEAQEAASSWTVPATDWYSQFAAKILAQIPYEAVLVSDAKPALLKFIAGVIEWTNAKNSPPWTKKGRRNRDSSRYFEWTHELGETIGRVSGLLRFEEVKSWYLDPIFALDDEPCWSMLSSFVSTYICRYVYDAKIVPDDAIKILSACLERLLRAPEFVRGGYRSGEFSGFDQPRLIRSLMFVSVEHAALAARYVNGDWSEIGRIMPLIDRFVRAGGWSSSLISDFLTLCERAREAYPTEAFADQILAVIGDGTTPLKGWHGTLIPARIASLVHHLADRDTPIATNVAQKLLRILDLLVDMGDRRSAALQLSETFREIKAA